LGKPVALRHAVIAMDRVCGNNAWVSMIQAVAVAVAEDVS